MLRQVIDWAASRSTELLTRYKQMATNIGFSDNFNSYEYGGIFQELSRNRHDGGSERSRPCGRRTGRNHSGEPFQPSPLSKKRRRRQARRQENSTGTVPYNVASGPDGKRRCSPAGRTSEEVSMSSDWLELSGLTLFFNRRVRLPVTYVIQTKDDPEWGNRETYAQIVKTPKVARDEWLKHLDRQTEMMTTELDKWRSRFRIFSVSVEMTGEAADELGDPKGQDSLKHQILVQRLKKKLGEYFGEIFQSDEIVLWQDGTKHKSMHFGPTEDAVEREIRSGKPPKMMKKIVIHVQKEIEVVHERSVAPTTEELEDSFFAIEDKFWSKQDHYLKRKSGKASRKRLREPGPCVAVPTKKEIVSMEAAGCVAGAPVSKKKCEFEVRNKRVAELAGRKRLRRDVAICISEDANTSNSSKGQSSGQENTAQSLPKRLELMQAKYRRFMKKLEKARIDGKLQTVNLGR